MKDIFVFGSNLAGIHGAGSAAEARINHGAIRGQGYGLQGDSFAIPTKNEYLRTLPTFYIEAFIHSFLWFAHRHPEYRFTVVKIGCGLAGFTEDQIKPFFAGAPDNCILPDGWRT